MGSIPSKGRRGPRGATSRPTRASPPALTRARIVEAALGLVADEGLAAFSTRKLGERLNCEAMSIYHHFPSKQHLLDALVDHMVGSIDEPPQGLPPLQRLRHLMDDWRAMYRRNPALFPLVAVHRLNTPTGVRTIELVLRTVYDVVRDDEKAARHFRAIGYYLMGAGLDETAGYAKGPSAAEPVGDAFIAAHCPRLVASARYFQRAEWDRTFEVGAQALLDAVMRDAPRG